MSAAEIEDLLGREPFEPFRIRLSSGDAYEVRNPHLVALMRNRIFLALPRNDRWVFIPFLHITAIESIANGHAPRSSRRRRRR